MIVKFRKTPGAAQVVWSTGMYTALLLGTMMKEISQLNTAVISCAAKVQEQNEKLCVRTDVSIVTV